MEATHTSVDPQPAVLRSWLDAALRTDDSRALLAARLSLGLVMLPHGAQKLLGWFDGFGFSATMGYFTTAVGLPWIIALLVILIESFGAVALIAGIGSRVAAVGTGVVMLGAIVTSHLSHGFFMNWGGTQAGEGYEYHILAIGLAAAVAIAGGGAWSIDRLLSRTRRDA